MFLSLACLLGPATSTAYGQTTPAFDYNADGIADRLGSDPVLERVQIISGIDDSILATLLGAQTGERFGASAALTPDLSGDGIADIVIAAPDHTLLGEAVGAVYARSGSDASALWTSFGVSGARAGAATAWVPDQDRDLTRDLLVQRISDGGQAVDEALLFSGRTGELLAVRAGTFAALIEFAAGGGRLYLNTDFDDSGTVGVSDLQDFFEFYADTDIRADVNADGVLSGEDIALMIDDFEAALTTVRALAVAPGVGGASSGGAGSGQQGATPDPCECANVGSLGGGSGDCSGASITLTCPGGVTEGVPISLPLSWSLPAGASVSLIPPCVSVTSLDGEGAGFVSDIGGIRYFFGTHPGLVRIRVRLTFTLPDGTVCQVCAECELEVVEDESCQTAVDLCPSSIWPRSQIECIPRQDAIHDPCEDWAVAGRGTAFIARGSPAGGVYRWDIVSGAQWVESMVEHTGSYGGGLILYVLPVPDGGCDDPVTPEVEECTVVLRVRYAISPCDESEDFCLVRLSSDSDFDGLSDHFEDLVSAGTDPLCPNKNNPDTDNDDFSDGTEWRLGTDLCDDTSYPLLGLDTDRDGLSDFEELEVHGTSWLHFDTDNDGAQDLAELELLARPAMGGVGGDPAIPFDPLRPTTIGQERDGDSAAYLAHDVDRDGLYDSYEEKRGWDRRNPDQDGDGIRDGFEMRRGLDPSVPDQGAAAPGDQTDGDGDGLTDVVEERIGTDPSRPDSDADGVGDGNEAAMGLDPTDTDSDNDGMADGEEDYDGDGVSNEVEEQLGSNPFDRDTDDDGECDGGEASRGDDPAGGPDYEEPPVYFDENGNPLPSGCRKLLWGVANYWDGIRQPFGTVNGRSMPLYRCCDGPRPYASIPFQYDRWYMGRTNCACPDIIGLYLCTGGSCLIPPNEPTECGGWSEWLTVPGRCGGLAVVRHRWGTGLPPHRIGPDSNGDGTPDYYDYDGDGDADEDDRRMALKIDVDIDSDNDNGYGTPERNKAEEDLEEDAESPGKIILASTFDSDGDNIPDYADGYSLFDESGYAEFKPDDDDEPRLDADSEGARLVTLMVQIPAALDAELDRIVLTYSRSDPKAVHTTAGDPFALPGSGRLRVWAPNALTAPPGAPPLDPNAVDPPDLAGEDTSAPGQPCDNRQAAMERRGRVCLESGRSYTAAELGVAPGQTAVWFVEAVGPSESVGGDEIKVEIRPHGESHPDDQLDDKVKLTALEQRFVAVNEDGSIGDPLRELPVSHPTPLITIESFAVERVYASGDGTRVLADLRLVGEIDDAASDLIPGSTGVISQLDLLLNNMPARTFQAPNLPITVPVTFDKDWPGAESDLLHPYDYSGAFDSATVLNGVVVQVGMNSVQLSATNSHGLTGSAEFSFRIDANPPNDERIAVEVLTYGQSVGGVAGQTVLLRLRSGPPVGELGAYVEYPLVWTGVAREFSDGALTATLEGPAEFDPLLQEVLTVHLSTPATNPSALVFGVVETEVASTWFIGELVLGEADRSDWRGYGFSAPPSGITQLRTTGGGEFSPFVIELAGPSGMFPEFADRVEIGGVSYSIAVTDGHNLLRAQGRESPSVLLAVPRVTTTPGTIPSEPSEPARDLRGEGNQPYEVAFTKGFGRGIWDTGVAVKDGAVDLFDATWYVLKNYNTISVGLRLYKGDSLLLEADGARLKAIGAALEAIADVARKIVQDQEAFVRAVILGDTDELDRLSEEYGVYFEIAVEVIDALKDEIASMTPDQQGWICGRIVGEVAVQVVPAVLSGGSTVAAQAGFKGGQLASVVAKISDVRYLRTLFKVGGRVDSGTVTRSSEKLAPVLEKAAILLTTRMCFVAATPVQTTSGALPIECVKPGDYVLSRDPETGEQGYQRVLSTVVTHPDTLYHVQYTPILAVGGGGDHKPATLIGTGEHPFYSVSREDFVPAAELVIGEELALASGGTAFVTDIQVQRGPPTRPFTTFNLEVEEFHTYFAGEHGVWVHNAGSDCERFASLLIKWINRPGNRDANGRGKWLAAFEDTTDLLYAIRRQRLGPDWELGTETKTKFLNGMVDLIFREAIPDGGIPEPKMTFSYNEWDAFFDRLGPTWARSVLRMEVNHAGPKRVVTDMFAALGRPEPSISWLNSNVPSFPMQVGRHGAGKGLVVDGVYQPTFHDFVNAGLNDIEGIPSSDDYRRVIRESWAEMQTAYGATDNISYSSIGAVVDKWIGDCVIGTCP